MVPTYPTLAISHVLPPHEIRVLWLSLYAGALARGTSTDDAIEFAHRGCVELSAAVVEGVAALPSWLRDADDERAHAGHIDREAVRSLDALAWRAFVGWADHDAPEPQHEWHRRYREVSALYVDLGGEG